MIITAAVALTAHLSIASIFTKSPRSSSKGASTPTCHIETVSYKFVGEPGTVFTYDGEDFRVPSSGWIELLASRKPAIYRAGGRQLPLDVWPRDEFGMRTVPLPSKARTNSEQPVLDSDAPVTTAEAK